MSTRAPRQEEVSWQSAHRTSSGSPSSSTSRTSPSASATPTTASSTSTSCSSACSTRASSSSRRPTPTGAATRDYKRSFHEAAIELIEVPAEVRRRQELRGHPAGRGRDGHVLPEGAHQLLRGRARATPTSRRSSRKLKENNKYVIGLGVKNSTSDLLIENCDEFIFYEDLVRGQQRPLPVIAERAREAAGVLRPPGRLDPRPAAREQGGPLGLHGQGDHEAQEALLQRDLLRLPHLLATCSRTRSGAGIVILRRDQKSGSYIVEDLGPAARGEDGRDGRRGGAGGRSARPSAAAEAAAAGATGARTPTPTAAARAAAARPRRRADAAAASAVAAEGGPSGGERGSGGRRRRRRRRRRHCAGERSHPLAARGRGRRARRRPRSARPSRSSPGCSRTARRRSRRSALRPRAGSARSRPRPPSSSAPPCSSAMRRARPRPEAGGERRLRRRPRLALRGAR